MTRLGGDIRYVTDADGTTFEVRLAATLVVDRGRSLLPV